LPIDSLGVLLECNPDFRPSFSSGFHIRGLFYKTLKSVDPGFSSWLHEYGGLAPFSVSPLIRVGPGLYLFKITSYLTKLSDMLVRTFGRLSEVELLNKRFRVLEISYARLDLDRLTRDSKPYTRYELEFLSPTCFRRPCPYIPLHAMGLMASFMRFMGKPKSHYRFLPLPDPILMLRNLKRQWDQYAGLSLKTHRFSRWLEEGGVAISGVSDIRTYKLFNRAKGMFFVGFTGRVRLSLPADIFREDSAEAVNVLLKVGEKTQVGVNRTAGFGMYKILKMLE